MLTQAEQATAWGHGCYHGKFATLTLPGGGRVSVRPEIIEAVSTIARIFSVWSYVAEPADTGGFACRHKTGNPSETSNHGRAIAIDITWRLNPYGRTLVTNMDRAMVQAICGVRTNNGKQVWNWGGNWSGNKDAMHYEIVCTPGDLLTGINWATVPAAVSTATGFGLGNPANIDSPPEDDDDMWIMINPHATGEHWLTNGLTKRPIRSPDAEVGLGIVNGAMFSGKRPMGPFPVPAAVFDEIEVQAEYNPKFRALYGA